MNPLFKKLYEHVAGWEEIPIRLYDVVVPEIKALTGQDEIYFIAVELNPEVSLGHIKQYRDTLTPVYSESKWITEIRYWEKLNECHRRFVCCKELMHIFDSEDERTDTEAKFKTLLGELESNPLPDEASEMFLSENRTKWMALAILCPAPLRDHFKPKYESLEMSAYEIALALRIPESLIKPVMSKSYERALNALLSEEIYSH